MFLSTSWARTSMKIDTIARRETSIQLLTRRDRWRMSASRHSGVRVLVRSQLCKWLNLGSQCGNQGGVDSPLSRSRERRREISARVASRRVCDAAPKSRYLNRCFVSATRRGNGVLRREREPFPSVYPTPSLRIFPGRPPTKAAAERSYRRCRQS